LPYVVIKTSKLFLHLQKGYGVLDGRVDLQAVSDNPLILKQGFNLCLVKENYPFRFEVFK